MSCRHKKQVLDISISHSFFLLILMAIKMNTMTVSIPACNQSEALVGFPGGLSMTSLKFRQQQQKEKVVIVMGATGTGKSRLSIDLATHFPAEIVNCDKIQVYHGLDIVTNKVTEEECRGIPHHLLGIVDPDADFTAADFCHHANVAIGSIADKGKVPIIAGGSNSLIASLVNDDPCFRRRYECCFLWVDVSLSILRSFVWDRVDRMVEAGLVEEVRSLYNPSKGDDYTRGIRRAIGVPEMDQFLYAEANNADKETLEKLLREGIHRIKENTYKLASLQLQKIHRLRDFWGWDLHHINATHVFLKEGDEASQAWEKAVMGPSTMVVDQFLNRVGYSPVITRALPMSAMAAATY